MKYKLFIIIIYILCSCSSSTSSEDEKMIAVVKEYFAHIKENKIEEIPSLFWATDNFSGVIKAQAFFINKHYADLGLDNLINQIKIKDTTSVILSQKQKYIQFTIKKSDVNLPIIITFIFDKMYGLDKITSPNVLQNQMYWNKSLDSLHQKGIFPRPMY